MKKRLFLLLCLLLFPIVAFADKVSIGETEYTATTLSEVDAALSHLENGGTIKFLENATLVWTISNKSNITIDINGKNIKKFQLYGDTNIKITNSGTTGTITDIAFGLTNQATTGTVEKIAAAQVSVAKGSTATLSNNDIESFSNYGNTTIESGTFAGPIDNNENNITFNGGSVTSTSYIFKNWGTDIIINAGTFMSTGDDGAFIINHEEDGNVVVNGGTFTGRNTIVSSMDGETTINGGTFTTTTSFSPFNLTGGKLNFKGGKVTAKNASTTFAVAVGGEFNFGVKSSNPSMNDPILETPKGTASILSSTFHFYSGTMYLKEAIPTDAYKSEVSLYDLVYEKQSDGSYKAYLKSSTVQDDLWIKYKKAFKNNDVLTSMKKDTNYDITITEDDNSISMTIKNKTANHTRTVKFSYANGIISLANPIEAGSTSNKDDLYNSVADMNAISNAIKALADVKGYKYGDLLPFIFANGPELTIAKDGAEFKYTSVPYKGADMTEAEKKAFGDEIVQYEVTTVFKLDLKNGVKTFNEAVTPAKGYSCKRVDGLFYDKDGYVVSKAEYEKACPEAVPDTGYIIPSIVVGILSIAFIIYKKFNFKNKITRI